MKCDWSKITSAAYLTLLELDLHEFPIPAKKIKCKDVMICSYQKYSKITDCTIEKITLGHELDDAFLLKGLRPGLTMILYDKEKYDARLKHTLWHEVGHIKCNHKNHGEQEEIEAHFFATQANAPNVLIKAISQRGYTITIHLLMKCFGLSEAAAKKKKEYLSRYGFEHSNEFDDLVLAQFLKYLDTNYPPKNPRFYDDYYDDMEREREKW